MPTASEMFNRMGCAKSFKEMETIYYLLSSHATTLIATENGLWFARGGDEGGGTESVKGVTSYKLPVVK